MTVTSASLLNDRHPSPPVDPPAPLSTDRDEGGSQLGQRVGGGVGPRDLVGRHLRHTLPRLHRHGHHLRGEAAGLHRRAGQPLRPARVLILLRPRDGELLGDVLR